MKKQERRYFGSNNKPIKFDKNKIADEEEAIIISETVTVTEESNETPTIAEKQINESNEGNEMEAAKETNQQANNVNMDKEKVMALIENDPVLAKQMIETALNLGIGSEAEVEGLKLLLPIIDMSIKAKSIVEANGSEKAPESKGNKETKETKEQAKEEEEVENKIKSGNSESKYGARIAASVVAAGVAGFDILTEGDVSTGRLVATGVSAVAAFGIQTALENQFEKAMSSTGYRYGSAVAVGAGVGLGGRLGLNALNKYNKEEISSEEI